MGKNEVRYVDAKAGQLNVIKINIIDDSNTLIVEEGQKEVLFVEERGKKSLKKLIIPEGIEAIGKLGISYCDNLEEIVCPSSLKKISDLAFCGCDNLEKFVLKDGLEEIGKSIFKECYSLREIKLPTTIDINKVSSSMLSGSLVEDIYCDRKLGEQLIRKLDLDPNLTIFCKNVIFRTDKHGKMTKEVYSKEPKKDINKLSKTYLMMTYKLDEDNNRWVPYDRFKTKQDIIDELRALGEENVEPLTSENKNERSL